MVQFGSFVYWLDLLLMKYWFEMNSVLFLIFQMLVMLQLMLILMWWWGIVGSLLFGEIWIVFVMGFLNGFFDFSVNVLRQWVLMKVQLVWNCSVGDLMLILVFRFWCWVWLILLKQLKFVCFMVGIVMMLLLLVVWKFLIF